MNRSQINSYYLHQYQNSEQHLKDIAICEKWPTLKANYEQASIFDFYAFQQEQEIYLAAKERRDNLDKVRNKGG